MCRVYEAYSLLQKRLYLTAPKQAERHCNWLLPQVKQTVAGIS